MTVSEAFTNDAADRYRIEQEPGAGGMATVYLANFTSRPSRLAPVN